MVISVTLNIHVFLHNSPNGFNRGQDNLKLQISTVFNSSLQSPVSAFIWLLLNNFLIDRIIISLKLYAEITELIFKNCVKLQNRIKPQLWFRGYRVSSLWMYHFGCPIWYFTYNVNVAYWERKRETINWRRLRPHTQDSAAESSKNQQNLKCRLSFQHWLFFILIPEPQYTWCNAILDKHW